MPNCLIKPIYPFALHTVHDTPNMLRDVHWLQLLA
ncbi:uncharacterized protein J3R85_007219 [Psidium guajava]|nr:uncharacterized protein J3R85_007219 [Psidium guajava]